MGTRNLVAVYVDGTHKIAQYGQWDGYPSGQGATVLEFLRSLNTPVKIDAFREKVRAARFATDEEIEAAWKSAGATSEWVTTAVADRMKRGHPQFSRDTGGEILGVVNEADPGIALSDRLSFAADGLFCEWAYVVDLDTNVLEVYRGFRQGDVLGRFKDMKATEDGYSPVHLIATFDLAALPTKAAFVRHLEKLVEELEAEEV